MAHGHNHGGGASRGHQQDNTEQQKQAGEGWGGRAPCTVATPHRKQPWDTVVGDQAPAARRGLEHTSRHVSATCAGNGPPTGSPEAPHGSAEAP